VDDGGYFLIAGLSRRDLGGRMGLSSGVESSSPPSETETQTGGE